jgi:hypothetical protein
VDGEAAAQRVGFIATASEPAAERGAPIRPSVWRLPSIRRYPAGIVRPRLRHHGRSPDTWQVWDKRGSHGESSHLLAEVEQVFDRVAAVTADSMLLALLVAGIAGIGRLSPATTGHPRTDVLRAIASGGIPAASCADSAIRTALGPEARSRSAVNADPCPVREIRLIGAPAEPHMTGPVLAHIGLFGAGMVMGGWPPPRAAATCLRDRGTARAARCGVIGRWGSSAQCRCRRDRR